MDFDVALVVADERRVHRSQVTMQTARLSLVFAGLSGAIGVVAGAWGSHAGSSVLDAGALRLVEIGARYQLLHAAALLGVAAISVALPGRPALLAAILFVAGTVLFSGSLYLLAATGERAFGSITPFGGLSFIAGWLALAAHAFFHTRRK